MSNEYVISLLKDNGFRITKQRKLILDIILSSDGASCKEIYHKVVSKDSTVGTATVYRMIRLLEDVGILKHIDMISLTGAEE
ncbi:MULTISPECIES: Fur family transcriptional regulator [unclassified Butyrivibrio]|uniref:Fur family transcriptional regulator n=1 Tax=unclassified Butyrivibrio TaxID=2639466 RepID=UPI0003F8C509|nr:MULTISPECIES: transcriptional repressor [unclassified Butyrivibrio]